MAIIKLGVTVVGIRGTLGGITFSGNKSGPYAKAWSQSSNPQTTFQQGQRRSIAEIPSLWRALTAGQMAAWDTFAALPAQDRTNSLGETFSASGFNWFTITNTRLINMGRTPNVAVPVIARPAAPTITQVQLPFLPGQTAYVLYISNNFGATLDLVLDVTVSISTGLQNQPRTFKQLMLNQSPPLEQQGFVSPYLERISLQDTTYKGFFQLYRQTEEGIRSAADTFQFESGDTPAFDPNAQDFDGINDWSALGADWTGNADSKIGVFSCFFKPEGGDGTTRNLFSGTTGRCIGRLVAANTLQFRFKDSAAVDALNITTVATFLAGSGWHHVALAWDLNAATQRLQLFIDGAAAAFTLASALVDTNLDWTETDQFYAARAVSTNPWDGCLTSFYLNNEQFLDISNPNNLAIFIDTDGSPRFLGLDGSFPTQQIPRVYFSSGVGTTNNGSGGNYTQAGGSGACSDEP